MRGRRWQAVDSDPCATRGSVPMAGSRSWTYPPAGFGPGRPTRQLVALRMHLAYFAVNCGLRHGAAYRRPPLVALLMPILPRTLASFLCSAAAISQGNAGYADLSFQNPTAQGTATLTATVYYPAMAPGRDAPLLPRAGGHPVVVFLHGLNVLGRGYGALGQRFAEQGYVVVLGNTALSSATTQINDGIAMFPALVQANGQAGHLLQGALDMGRAAVSGHSMGGSSTCGVLAANPGYRAGFCFSPGVAPAAAQVHV